MAKAAKSGSAARLSVFNIITPVRAPTPNCAKRPGYLIIPDPDHPATYCNAVICVVGTAQDGADLPTEVAAKAASSATPLNVPNPPGGSQHVKLPGTTANFRFDHTTKEVPCDCTDAGKDQYLGVWAKFGANWVGPEIVHFVAKCCACTECPTSPTVTPSPVGKKKAAVKKAPAKKKPAKKKAAKKKA